MNQPKRKAYLPQTINDKKLHKSKSPDIQRQKIPTFKPKTLQQIFQQTQRKKSPFKTQINNSNTQNNFQIIKNNLASSQKNSLADLIVKSGHQQDIQSIQYTNSQFEQHYDQDFDKFSSQQLKKPQKYQLRVLTPQWQPFSKLSKQQNPFKFKDDSVLKSLNEVKNEVNHWKGELTLTTSMCEQDFEQMQEQGQIPIQIKDLVFKNDYYVYCINSQNKNEFLFESNEVFNPKTLVNKIIQMQRKYNKRDSDKQGPNSAKIIKFLSTSQMDQFMGPDIAHQYVEKYLSTELLPNKKFTQLIYFVEAESKNKQN